MNFQGLSKIEDSQFYLDTAIRHSRKIGEAVFRQTSGLQFDRIRKTEIEKLKSCTKVLTEKFGLILKNFPSLDGMSEFYQELVRSTLDYDNIKKSLGALKWASDNISRLSKEFEKRLRRSKDKGEINILMRGYYGRTSSIVKQVDKNLRYLDHARMAMRDYPTIKTDLYTVAITGFPNIGKSTLLSKLTPAKPKIEDYPFTTIGLNQGYSSYGTRKIQFVDTPGVLGRDKKNAIEQQAYLVLKYLANLIVYIIDLTEPYVLKKQEELLKGLREYEKPTIVYLSKSDVLEKKLVDKYKRKYKATISIDEVNKKIEKAIKEYYFEK